MSAPRTAADGAEHVEAALADLVPEGYLGPVVLPGSGRTVWWTGRIAIGLRYQRPPRAAAAPGGEAWLQALLLRAGRPRRTA